MTMWAGRRFAGFASSAVFVVSTSAAAEPSAEASSALLPPPVTVKVTPGTHDAPWTLKIDNTGDEPVRLAADPRLLSLEITPPVTDATATKKRAASPSLLRCVLPDSARPPSDEASQLVVPEKRSWSATFDPFFYCFGAREREALVAGATVRARFGWPEPRPRAGAKSAPLTSPLAITPVGAAVGKISAAKGVDAEPVTLTEAVMSVPPPSPSDEPPPVVALVVPAAMDAARGVELATTVTLKNEGSRPITLLFRPDMIELRVTRASGSLWCGAPRAVDAPIRELFITVPAKGKVATSILLTATCPVGTFDDPGVYRIVPRLDTTNASGRSIGLVTWEGVATATAPLLVRVRTPKSPALPPPPTLD